MTRVYADMVADLFHAGHVEFLRQAEQLQSWYPAPSELGILRLVPWDWPDAVAYGPGERSHTDIAPGRAM